MENHKYPQSVLFNQNKSFEFEAELLTLVLDGRGQPPVATVEYGHLALVFIP